MTVHFQQHIKTCLRQKILQTTRCIPFHKAPKQSTSLSDTHKARLSCEQLTHQQLRGRSQLIGHAAPPNSSQPANKVQNSGINPFQSNFSANHILPSSYLFIPAIILQVQPCKYNAQSPFHIKTHGLSRNRKSTTCAVCWPKSVLHDKKRRTGSDSGAGATKSCRTSSDIGAEQENHNVGRGPMEDRKGLKWVIMTCPDIKILL